MLEVLRGEVTSVISKNQSEPLARALILSMPTGRNYVYVALVLTIIEKLMVSTVVVLNLIDVPDPLHNFDRH